MKRLLLLFVLLLFPATAHATSATLVAPNCNPVWTNGTAMIFNTKDANGIWVPQVGDTSCQNARPMFPSYAGHRGISDVTADGSEALVETDMGNPLGQTDAQPGKGYGDEIQLATLDGNQNVTQLTTLTTGRPGTIWAVFSPDGTKVAWAQMVESAFQTNNWWDYLLGIWNVHWATITPGGLTNEQSYAYPGDIGFTETDSWLDNNTILFTSDAGITPKNPWGYWLSAQNWALNTTTDTATEFSQKQGGQWTYHEFAELAPSGTFTDPGPWIITAIDYLSNSGMDLWREHPDGSDPQRLTYFNGQWGSDWKYDQVPGFPPPAYAVPNAHVAFDPTNSTVAYTGVCADMNCASFNAYRIQF